MAVSSDNALRFLGRHERLVFANFDVALALGLDAYLHLTSPIPRYADLVAHRALRDALAGGAQARRRAQARAERMATWAVRASLSERTATEAAHEAIDLRNRVVIRERLGECFEATLTRIAPRGFIVTLDDFFFDGLVPARTLRAPFERDETRVARFARGNGERFELADWVHVRVSEQNIVRGGIDSAMRAHQGAGALGKKGQALA